jgi:Cdc6-like AAA superfamily ATPase
MYHVRLLDDLDVHHRLVFDCVSHSLLILGEPGFGKTVTLLELVRSLLELTGGDDIQPVPLVLSLSYWSNFPTKPEDWVAHELVSKCHAPKYCDIH